MESSFSLYKRYFPLKLRALSCLCLEMFRSFMDSFHSSTSSEWTVATISRVSTLIF